LHRLANSPYLSGFSSLGLSRATRCCVPDGVKVVSVCGTRPRWVGAVTACVCGVLLLGTSPLVASSSSDVPAPVEALASQADTKAKSSAALPDFEKLTAPKNVPKPDFSPLKKPEKLDPPQEAMRHYELYSWSHQYRQEWLVEAGRPHLEE
jgi:hypothetical protein